MRRDRELFEDEEKSQKDIPGGLSPDDDIIELVDVVREGDPLPDSDGDDLSLLLNEEGRPEAEEDFLDREDEDLDGFSLSLDETSKGTLESALDERDDAFSDPFESPDFDFEAPESLNEPTAQAVKDLSEVDLDEIPEHGLSEMPTEHPDDIPDEDLDLVMAGLADDVEEKTSRADAGDDELPSVSQERLEARITETVTEVVERVVRETVAEVAEKVIKEAIEGLKHSLESKPEQPLL